MIIWKIMCHNFFPTNNQILKTITVLNLIHVWFEALEFKVS